MIPPRTKPRLRYLYLHPWHSTAADSMALRRWCDRHDQISPHFTWHEAKCHDGTPVPDDLKANAIRQAWNLERLRHRIGPLQILSWYRTPPYNRQIGGATQSRHMSADACDFDKGFIDRIGRSRFFYLGHKFFVGIGHYPSGSGHLDSRPGPSVEWSSF